MPRLTIATCQTPHAFSQEPDDVLLLEALHQAGIVTDLVPWDDLTYDWSRSDLVLIRSIWDYPRDPLGFLSWASKVARTTTLWNPATLLHWNAHKTYLLDLHTQGIPIIPTVWLPTHSQVRLASLMRYHGWNQIVIKPVVGTGSRAARVVTSSTLDAGEEHLSALLEREAVMVQPFLPSFYSVGEHALIFVNDIFTHAVRKRFSLVEGLDQEGLCNAQITEEELACAQQVLQRLPVVPLVARVDLVRDHHHQLLLNELEVIEPILYLSQSPQALHRLTQGCCRLLQQTEKTRSIRKSQQEEKGLHLVPFPPSSASLQQSVTIPIVAPQ